MQYPTSPTSRFGRAMLVVAVIFAAACADSPPEGADSGPPKADAQSDAAPDLSADDAQSDAAPDLSADDAQSDAAPDLSADGVQSDVSAMDSTLDPTPLDTPSDALADATSGDGDGACTCTTVDSGRPAPWSNDGIMSLPCYCAMPWPGLPGATPCASYSVATQCDSAHPSVSVETYTNCNLVTVRYGGGFSVDARVYDHSTLEFVGAFRGTDYSLPCGASRAFTIMSGIIPGPECQTAKIEFPCADAGAGDDAGDASPPADVADAGCACEPDERNQGGEVSLACYCAPGGCLPYDQALTRCNSDAPPDANRIDDYEACNLVVLTSGTSIPGGSAYVFDRTTHELVGASFGADYPAFKCGDASVFGWHAGRFPPPGCTVSRSVPRCPRDGGG